MQKRHLISQQQSIQASEKHVITYHNVLYIVHGCPREENIVINYISIKSQALLCSLCVYCPFIVGKVESTSKDKIGKCQFIINRLAIVSCICTEQELASQLIKWDIPQSTKCTKCFHSTSNRPKNSSVTKDQRLAIRSALEAVDLVQEVKIWHLKIIAMFESKTRESGSN